MTCEHIIAELPDFLAHQLPTPQQGEIQAHLEICVDCAQLVSDYQAVEAALPCWKVPPPQNLPTAAQLLQQARVTQNSAVQNLATLENNAYHKAQMDLPAPGDQSAPTRPIASQLVVPQANNPDIRIAKHKEANLLTAQGLNAQDLNLPAQTSATAVSRQNKDAQPATSSFGSWMPQWWSGGKWGYLPWATAMAGALSVVVLVGYYYNSNNKLSMVAWKAPSSPAPTPAAMETLANKSQPSSSVVGNAERKEANVRESGTATPAADAPVVSSPIDKQSGAVPTKPVFRNTQPEVRSRDKVLDNDVVLEGNIPEGVTGEVVGGVIAGQVAEGRAGKAGIKALPDAPATPSLPPRTEMAKAAPAPAPAAASTANTPSPQSPATTSPSSVGAVRQNDMSSAPRNSSTYNRGDIAGGGARNGLARPRSGPPTEQSTETEELKITGSNETKTSGNNKDVGRLDAKPARTNAAPIIVATPRAQSDSERDTMVADNVEPKRAEKKAANATASNSNDPTASPTESSSKVTSKTGVLAEVNLALIVSDLATAQSQIAQLVSRYQGELITTGQSNSDSDRKSVKSISYVPRKVADQFFAAIRKLGTLHRNNKATKVCSWEEQQRQLMVLEAAKPRDEAKLNSLKSEIAELQKRSQQTKFVIEIMGH